MGYCEIQMVKIVGFAGNFYVLSGWNIDRTGTFQKKYWINQKGKRPAAVVLYSDGRYKALLYDPEGELIDVIAGQSKREFFNRIRDSLAFYVEEGKIHPNRTSKEFKDWFGI